MSDTIHALDWAIIDFTADCVDRVEAGAHVAAGDIARLHRMAGLTARFIAELTAMSGGLDAAVDPGIPAPSPAEFRELVAEAVAERFRMTPAAARLFGASLDAAK